MSVLDLVDALETAGDLPWYCEPKDKDPRSEFARQVGFLNALHKQAPAIDALAIPNARHASAWEHIQRWREGARGGALDLILSWDPVPGDRGVFFAEFKSGQTMPSRQQRDRLNWYHRHGFRCGVYRNGDTLLQHLRDAGAPFLDWSRA